MLLQFGAKLLLIIQPEAACERTDNLLLPFVSGLPNSPLFSGSAATTVRRKQSFQLASLCQTPIAPLSSPQSYFRVNIELSL